MKSVCMSVNSPGSLPILTGDEDDYLKKGTLEVDAMAASLAPPEQKSPQAAGETTIGSLKQS